MKRAFLASLILSLLVFCISASRASQPGQNRHQSRVKSFTGAVNVDEAKNADAELAKANGAPYTNFCQKRFLKTEGGKLYCNWSDSFAGACSVTYPTNRSIEKGSVITGPDESGKCGDDNNIIVKVTNN